jgi:hypothetical protein
MKDDGRKGNSKEFKRSAVPFGINTPPFLEKGRGIKGMDF